MATRKGAQVARRYHDEVVGPLLTRRHPHLLYAAGRLGEGSDVLGLDDAMSADHGWGLRLSVLLDDAGRVGEVRALLDAELPETFAGLPVRFPLSDDGPATLAVDVAGVAVFLQRHLGADPRQALTPHQWLGLTGQSVLEVVAGLVAAIDAVHARQVAAGLPVPATSPVEPFWSRPFRTVSASIVDGLTAAITDPQVRALPVGAGSVEQWIDNVDVLARPARRMAAATTL
jgi:hypothetical protein